MLSYDAVIIGAGHNGLACAAHLGARGWKVGVFEQAEAPGGAVKTRELTWPGFRHDAGAMNLSLFAGSEFHKRHKDKLAAQGLAFVPATECFASVFPDGRWCGVSSDLGATRARIAAFSPADAATWERLAAEFPARSAALSAILGRPMEMVAVARNLAGSLRGGGLAGSRELARLLLASPRAWLEETFEAPEVRAMLGVWGMHLDFAPDVAGGALFPYLEGMACQAFGMALGRGGSQTLTDALVGLVRVAGGEVRTGAAVAEIARGGGRASGVVLADGTAVAARRAVIAGVAPRALARLLPGGTGDRALDGRLAGFRHAPGTLMIHLALDELPPWAAGEELKRFAYVHVAPSLDAMALAYAEAMAGLLPRAPAIVVGQPTAVDPSRAPEGKHVLWVQVRMVPGRIAGDAAGEIAATDWPAVKDAYADRVMGMLEAYAPGLGARVLARAVWGPDDLERDNPNLVGGDQICGSHHLAQNFVFRPAGGAAGWDLPVKGLHLTGAATWPGAGVGAGSGFMLARKLAGG